MGNREFMALRMLIPSEVFVPAIGLGLWWPDQPKWSLSVGSAFRRGLIEQSWCPKVNHSPTVYERLVTLMMFVPCHLYHIIPLALAMFLLFLLGPRKRHSPQNPNCWSCCPLLRHPIPISPGLDPSTLETAWSLSDVDRDGTLTLGSADCPKLMETQKSHCDWRMGKMVIKHGILGYPVLRQPQSGQIAPKNPKVKPAVWPKDLPWVLLLHSPDHQRDAWGPHAQFARRPATATLGIADEPGTLGDPGGGEGGNSFAKLVLQCFLCFQLGGPCFGGL